MNRQTPFTTNQISNSKPSVPGVEVTLTGTIANSFNGGIFKPISYKKVMAGERHKQNTLQAKFHMLTPLTPAYQNLKATLYTFFCPNSRIWEDAEKYTAQNGGASEIKIEEIPNLGGKEIPKVSNHDIVENYTNLQNTTNWRDSYISTYIPRIGISKEWDENDSRRDQYTLPKISVLPLRGVKAIWNDLVRNKEYEEELPEYKSSTVSQQEWESYLPINGNLKNCMLRGRKQNSYYSDYRTELQGFDTLHPLDSISENEGEYLTSWLQWENKVSSARSQAEDAQATPWDTIAKIRGSKKLTEGKVQLIGKTTFNLNYAAITQSTYNSNENIQPEFRVMGKQGAYSYTEIKIPTYAGMIFNEEGYIHTFIQVSADTVYETAIDRNLLNVRWDDEYRPDLMEQKDDIIYEIEYGTNFAINTTDFTKARGFKRTFSELFKLPNIVAGDMTSADYFESYIDDTEYYDEVIITQKTYQFFESSDRIFYLESAAFAPMQKLIWKDYTDLLINKNQAIMNDMIGSDEELRIKGQNQIFFIGHNILDCYLPVDSSIIGNSTTWGEH